MVEQICPKLGLKVLFIVTFNSTLIFFRPFGFLLSLYSYCMYRLYFSISCSLICIWLFLLSKFFYQLDCLIAICSIMNSILRFLIWDFINRNVTPRTFLRNFIFNLLFYRCVNVHDSYTLGQVSLQMSLLLRIVLKRLPDDRPISLPLPTSISTPRSLNCLTSSIFVFSICKSIFLSYLNHFCYSLVYFHSAFCRSMFLGFLADPVHSQAQSLCIYKHIQLVVLVAFVYILVLFLFFCYIHWLFHPYMQK